MKSESSSRNAGGDLQRVLRLKGGDLAASLWLGPGSSPVCSPRLGGPKAGHPKFPYFRTCIPWVVPEEGRKRKKKGRDTFRWSCALYSTCAGSLSPHSSVQGKSCPCCLSTINNSYSVTQLVRERNSL